MKRKMEAKFNKPVIIGKSDIFKSQNDHKLSSLNEIQKFGANQEVNWTYRKWSLISNGLLLK